MQLEWSAELALAELAECEVEEEEGVFGEDADEKEDEEALGGFN